MQSDNIEMGEWNTDEMISNGIQMSGPVMTTTPVMTTSTVDTFDAGFSYSYDDIGQLDLFDEMDMREKYPALNQAYEHYQSVLEICKTKEKEDLVKFNADLLNSIDDKTKIKDKLAKLKDIRSTLVEKHKHHSGMVTFFENNDDCPTCEQHINEDFKKEMLSTKTTIAKELQTGLHKLQDELNNTNNRFTEITDTTKTIRSNEVKIATLGSSIEEIEKFNVKLDTEINIMSASDVSDLDLEKLEGLKENSKTIIKQRVKLKEDKVYAEASRAMLQDTGIKTKIIKQYLPIMNKLINTYLTSMEFYVNFTLDENFNETIKSRFRDEFTYASFSEGEKMRIDLALLFTWRAIAKMKNSTNTNLLVLDEIFDSSLDGTGTDEFLKILNTLAKENVFVISHKGDTLYDKFRSVVKFEKVKNFSHVVT